MATSAVPAVTVAPGGLAQGVHPGYASAFQDMPGSASNMMLMPPSMQIAMQNSVAQQMLLSVIPPGFEAASHTPTTKLCQHPGGCRKGAIGKARMCIAHGGGKRCLHESEEGVRDCNK